MSLSFRRYDPDTERDAFERFISGTYGPASFLRCDDYVRWWFGRSPTRPLDGPTDLFLAWRDDDVVGMNANIVSGLSDGDTTRPLTWLANTMVVPHYRQLGLGLRLVQESMRAFPNVGSISFRAGAQRILEHLEFDLVGQMGRAVALADEDLASKLGASERVAADLRHARSHARRPARQSDSSASVVLSDMTAPAALWTRVRPRYGLATERSEAHLRWRYLEHPTGQYHVRGWGHDRLDAVCVVRLDGDDVTAARIVDCFGIADAVAPLLTDTVAWATTQHCAVVDFFCTGCPDRAAFEQVGFTWLPEDRAAEVPFLFQPLEHGREYQEQVALRWSDARDRVSYDDTYFTRGDSDRDRPGLRVS